jgi:hypothetical protein
MSPVQTRSRRSVVRVVALVVAWLSGVAVGMAAHRAWEKVHVQQHRVRKLEWPVPDSDSWMW